MDLDADFPTEHPSTHLAPPPSLPPPPIHPNPEESTPHLTLPPVQPALYDTYYPPPFPPNPETRPIIPPTPITATAAIEQPGNESLRPWANEPLSAAERVKLSGRRRVPSSASVFSAGAGDVGEGEREERERAGSDVEMDGVMVEGEQKVKKASKKNSKLGLKRTLSDQITPASNHPDPSSSTKPPPKSKKPKLKPKGPTDGPSEAGLFPTDGPLKKKASRVLNGKKKGLVLPSEARSTHSPSPDPTSRARSYSQSVDPEGTDEYADVAGRKAAKRRKNEEREREMEELLRRKAEEEDEESEDDQVYCVCKSRYDADSPMIACDLCAEWYHPGCVEIPEEEIELVDLFVCPKCSEETSEKTTWRIKCRSAECYKPAVPPLTKYCSTACGTAHLTTLLEDKGIDLARHWNQVEHAQRPSGVVIANPDFPSPTPSLSGLPSEETANPALKHLHLTDSTLRSSVHKVQQQLHLLSNRLTLLSFASSRADNLPSLGTMSLRDERDDPDVVGKPSRSKKKHSANAEAGAGERPCGFDRRLILDDPDFGTFLERDGWDGDPERGLAGYLAEGERDVERRQGDAGKDVEMEGESFQETWCYRPRKKCDAHKGWQKVRLLDLQLELASKKDRLTLLHKKLDVLRRDIAVAEKRTRPLVVSRTSLPASPIPDRPTVDVDKAVLVDEVEEKELNGMVVDV